MQNKEHIPTKWSAIRSNELLQRFRDISSFRWWYTPLAKMYLFNFMARRFINHKSLATIRTYFFCFFLILSSISDHTHGPVAATMYTYVRTTYQICLVNIIKQLIKLVQSVWRSLRIQSIPFQLYNLLVVFFSFYEHDQIIYDQFLTFYFLHFQMDLFYFTVFSTHLIDHNIL